MNQPVKIFIAFSHKDELLEKELKNALQPIKLLKKAVVWDDYEVEAGADWDAVIRQNLLDSDIVLLLFSSDSLASEYFLNEVEIAVERHNNKQTIAIPIILRPCGWEVLANFSAIEALPKKKIPITSWSNRDEAFTSVFTGVHQVVENILANRKIAKETKKTEEIEAETFENERLAFADSISAANLLFKKGDFDSAKSIYQTLEINWKSGFSESIYFFNQKTIACDAALKKQKDDFEKNRLDRLFDEKLRTARQYFESGDRNNALRFVRDALAIRPLDADALQLKTEIEAIPVVPSFLEKNWKSLAGGLLLLGLLVFSFKFCPQNPALNLKPDDNPVIQPSLDGPTINPKPENITVEKPAEQPKKQDPKPTPPAPEPQKTSNIDVILAEIEASMVNVAGGTFSMGDESSAASNDEKPVHSVTLSTFGISKFEVKQSWYKALMNENRSDFNGDNLPVENVSWDKAQQFIKKLNEKTGKNYRLPTEAEWEFAARGGKKSNGYKYSGSNNLGEVAWFSENANSKTHSVGLKAGNELGLFDMSGNVWEWVEDRWHDNYNGAPSNGSAWISGTGSIRVNRGGGWGNSPQGCRAADRNSNSPADRYHDLGFRLARSL